jgi:hypothetical protein
MRIKQGLRLKELPRMADFAEWGEAVSRALGYGENAFILAYFRCIGSVNKEAIEAHVIGPAVLSLMNGFDEWVGTASELNPEHGRRALML